MLKGEISAPALKGRVERAAGQGSGGTSDHTIENIGFFSTVTTTVELVTVEDEGGA